MVAPEYVYGGNGMIERTEYDVLHGDELHIAATDAAINVEGVIEHSYASPWVSNSAKKESDSLERCLMYTYIDDIPLWDDFLLYDSEERRVNLWKSQDASLVQTVSIYHESYTQGPRSESYYIIFENTLPSINGSFTTCYDIEFFKGGSVNATLKANNISVEDDDASEVYQRPMTAYDFTCLKKQMDVLDAHFAVTQV